MRLFLPRLCKFHLGKGFNGGSSRTQRNLATIRYAFACCVCGWLLAVPASNLNAQSNQQQLLSSPNEQITMQLSVVQNQLRYQLQYKNQALASGSIGFAFGVNIEGSNGNKRQNIYGQSVVAIETAAKQHARATTVRLTTRGNHTHAKFKRVAYRFKVRSKDAKTDFWLEVRLYDNGIAYRYSVPSNAQTLESELSHIQLPSATRLWWQSDVHQYEGNYSSATFDQLPDSLKLGMPLTLQYQNGVYMALMEADIFGFVGSHFTHYTDNRTLDYTLAGPVRPLQGTTAASRSASGDILHSGWQIMAISSTLDGLVNNDIVRDVSAAPDKRLFPEGLATPWIRPGKSIWTWMSKKRDVTPENIQKFTDAAAQLKIPYNLIDDGWVKWTAPGKDHWQILKDQIDYANSKGVGIWVWQAYPPHNGTPGLKDTAYMRLFFQKCADLGVKGMKIDFIDAETEEKIAFYQRAAATAARYHLMVDFHGANKGTGMEYTYPNILTQEGVRGLEQQDNQHWPYLNTVLPFTRYLSGPADYTPLSFAPYVSSTTLAHQVATSVIFTSPFLCLGADPGELIKSIALPLVQQIPATWDETIILPQSKIGQVAAFARRKGKTWYLAVLNGDTARQISIDLSFLGRKKYALTALSDQLDSRESTVHTTKKINKKKRGNLLISLPSGGGYTGIFNR